MQTHSYIIYKRVIYNMNSNAYTCIVIWDKLGKRVRECKLFVCRYIPSYETERMYKNNKQRIYICSKRTSAY